MEGQLLWVLILQLIAIVFVAICILLYMMKTKTRLPSEGSKTILLTAADSFLGSQIAIYLASLGFRVFAGVSNVNSKESKRLQSIGSAWLHVISLDVTNDLSLAQAIKGVREHLHAGEKGLWAVIHLSGTGVKMSSASIGGDDEKQLRTALEVTVVGFLKLARASLPHLSAAKGRLIILGADENMSLGLRVWGSGALGVTHGVWTAARFAAEGLAAGLRAQLKPHGVPVISLTPDSYYAQRINEFPSPDLKNEIVNETEILSPYAMRAVEEAVLSSSPRASYVLSQSKSSRIKNIMVSFSPNCVSAVCRQQKINKMDYIPV